MRNNAYYALLALALGVGQCMADAAANQVAAIAACNGLSGDELTKCLARNGVAANVGQALGIPGFNPGTFIASARGRIQDAKTSARTFLQGITKSASALAYKAMGKEDVHNTAEEAGQFLGSLVWWGWAHNDRSPFPACIKTAQTMPETVKLAVQKWRNALMDQGIPASSPENVAALQSMGYIVVVNSLNLTVVTNSDRTAYWRKSPWGWLPCSADGKNIVDTNNRIVPIGQTNEAISNGTLVPMIWIKEESRWEPLSGSNFWRLVANNLKPFMPAGA